jgi:hypothetical protein
MYSGIHELPSPDDHLNPRIDVTIDICVNDDGNSLNGNESRLQRVKSCSMSIIGSTQMTLDDEVQPPTTVSHQIDGVGHIHRDIVRLLFQNVLHQDTTIVNTGLTISFRIVLGTIDGTNIANLKQCINATIVKRTLSRAAPARSAFKEFVPNEGASKVSEKDLAINYLDLSQLCGTNDTDMITVRNLYIDTSNNNIMASDVKIPKAVIVYGSVYIDCGQTIFIQSAAADFPKGSNGKLCVFRNVDGGAKAVSGVLEDGEFAYCTATLAASDLTFGYTATGVVNAPYLICNTGDVSPIKYQLSATPKTNVTFDATTTLPSLSVSGHVYGDLIYIGQGTLPAIAEKFEIDGGIVFGRPRITGSIVTFNDFECVNNGYLAGPDDLLVGTAISTGTNFLTVPLPIAKSTTIVNDSAVFTNLVTNSDKVSMNHSIFNEINHVAYPRPLDLPTISCVDIECTTFNTKYAKLIGVVVNTNTNHVLTNSKVDQYTINAKNSEHFSMTNVTLKRLVIITAANSGPNIYCNAVVQQSTAIESMSLDDHTTIILGGTVKIATIYDERTAPGTPFYCVNANVVVNKLNMNATHGFPLIAAQYTNSEVQLSTLNVVGTSVTPVELVIPVNPVTINNIIDTNNQLSGIDIVGGTIVDGNFSRRTVTTFTLKALASNVFLRFPPVSAVNGLVTITVCAGSNINVKNWPANVTNPDTLTKLTVSAGSTINYTAATVSPKSATFQNITIGYGVTLITNVNLPALTSALRKLFAITNVYNATNASVSASVTTAGSGAVSYKIRPNRVESASNPGLVGIAAVNLGNTAPATTP